MLTGVLNKLFRYTTIDSNRFYVSGLLGKTSIKELFINKQHEPHVTKVLKNITSVGDVVVDIGAFFGYYTVLSSKLVGNDGTVYSFEPSPYVYNILLKNIHLNQCRNVIPYCIALHDSISVKPVALSSYHGKTFGASIGVLPLDIFNIKPDIIKIDVEGAEFGVLRGMLRTVTSCNPDIVCEIHPRQLSNYGYNVGDIENYLKVVGYKSYLINSDGDLIKSPIMDDKTRHYLFRR